MKKFLFVFTVLLVLVNFVTASVYFELQDNNFDIKNHKFKLQKNKKLPKIPFNDSKSKISNFNFILDDNKDYQERKDFKFLFSVKRESEKIKNNFLVLNKSVNSNIISSSLLTNQQRK